MLKSLIWVWRLPLALASFGFYRMVRFLFRKAAASDAKKKLKNGAGHEWKGMSQLLEMPGFLPFLMVTGPRWNCHAVMGGLGPFEARAGLEIDIAAARASARHWTLVIYEGDNNAILTAVGAGSVPEDADTFRVPLRPGLYRIVLRYYGCGERVWFPAVTVDDALDIPAFDASAEGGKYQAYLDSVRGKHGAFYGALHYYIHPLLTWRDRLPEGFVRGEFLPVGNPETAFLFGPLEPGERLRVDLNGEAAAVYVVIYNASSFPLFWQALSAEGYTSPAMAGRGFYLIRIIRDGRQAQPTDAARVTRLTA
ncbi:DUF6208 family protein [Methylomagnum sp.]